MSEQTGLRPYLDAAASAEKDSLKEHADFVEAIDKLDALFRSLVAGTWHNKCHPICGILGMNAHANFLAAGSAAVRGQSPATFMLMRGCFESAIYAYLASLSHEDGEVWMKRSENPALAKARFNANRGIQKLSARDPNLASMAKDTYDWMIDFGGHPNARSILEHIRFNETLSNGDVPISLIYVNSAGSLAVIRALSACIENGCMVIAILSHTFPDHPSSDNAFSETWTIFKEFQQRLASEGYLGAKAADTAGLA